MLAALALAGAAVAAYVNGLKSAFLFDDDDSIRWNTSIRNLWSRQIFVPPHGGVTASGRPVFNASLALNWAWTRDQPWSYHWVNLIGHILAGLLLFGLARRVLIREKFAAKDAWLIAASASLLWLLHPLQTEAVTYTVQRCELMMGAFYLAVFYCLVRLVEAEEAGGLGLGWLFLGALASLGGMLSKEVMVSAPVMAFLFDWAFLRGTLRDGRRRRWTYWAFWVALAATWVPLAINVIGNSNRGGTSGDIVGVTPLQYWQTQGPAIFHYLRLTIWPDPLVLDYAVDWHVIHDPSAAIPANLGLVVLLAATVVLLFRRPKWGVLALLGFAILSPTSIVPGNRQTMAEHRMYLVLAPILVAAAIGGWRLFGSRHRRWFIATVLVVAVAYGIRVHDRNEDYDHPETLWRDNLKVTPQNYYAMCNLGAEIYKQGRNAEAEQTFQDAVAVNPNYAAAQSNLAVVLVAMHRAREAIPHLEAAIKLNPGSYQAANNMGVALADLHRWEEALPWYRHALVLRPDYPEPKGNIKAAYAQLAQSHFQAGLKLSAAGKASESLVEYEQAVKWNPNFANAYSNIGVAWLAAGNTQKAEAALHTAIRLAPTAAVCHYDLGLVFKAEGNTEGAMAEYAEAARLGPDIPEPANNYAILLWQAGKKDEARQVLNAFMQRHPDSAIIRATLKAFH
jgi:tetratricopeptide (TPR) repeat protein